MVDNDGPNIYTTELNDSELYFHDYDKPEGNFFFGPHANMNKNGIPNLDDDFYLKSFFKNSNKTPKHVTIL